MANEKKIVMRKENKKVLQNMQKNTKGNLQLFNTFCILIKPWPLLWKFPTDLKAIEWKNWLLTFVVIAHYFVIVFYNIQFFMCSLLPKN